MIGPKAKILQYNMPREAKEHLKKTSTLNGNQRKHKEIVFPLKLKEQHKKTHNVSKRK